MRSIIQEDADICFICGGYGASEWHHIFGGPYRDTSEHYGLKVRLHHNCHNEAPDGVHFNSKIMLKLHQLGQRKAMQKYGWDIDKFIEIFGQNYL